MNEELIPPKAPPRMFTPIRDRPPLREVLDAGTKMGADAEGDMKRMAHEIHAKAIQKRSEARRDAIVMVARARERGGQTATAWNSLEADTVFAITDLLMQVQGQELSPPDPAFAIRDQTLAHAARLASNIEEAVRRGVRDDPDYKEDDPPQPA